jgi:hypothetical protein
MSAQKNVRFSGIEQQKAVHPVGVTPRPQHRSSRPSCYSQVEPVTNDDYFEIEKTQFPNEVGIKK